MSIWNELCKLGKQCKDAAMTEIEKSKEDFIPYKERDEYKQMCESWNRLISNNTKDTKNNNDNDDIYKANGVIFTKEEIEYFNSIL